MTSFPSIVYSDFGSPPVPQLIAIPQSGHVENTCEYILILHKDSLVLYRCIMAALPSEAIFKRSTDITQPPLSSMPSPFWYNKCFLLIYILLRAHCV